MSGELRLVVQRELAVLLREALGRAVKAGELTLEPDQIPEPQLERPRQPEHGDWASNVALTLAKVAGAAPRRIAEAVVAHAERPDWVETLEVAGPGFVNIRLAHVWFEGLVRQVLARGDAYGTTDAGGGGKVQVEFISANPTGPLHVGNARWAAVGDALANLLTATGHDVTREYYLNDAGSQLDLLGQTVEAAWLTLEGQPTAPPDGGYKGAYIDDLARAVNAERGSALLAADPASRRAEITEYSYRSVLASIRATLARFGVHFDVWFSERTLHERGAVAAAVEQLQAAGTAYEADGAVWLRTSDFGDDKDRPMIRSNGQATYFGADVAYWRDKRQRGFGTVIYLLGADHHGYVGRMRAIVRASGDPDAAAEFIIGQMVNLYRGGQPVRMSKRAGTAFDFDELIDEVGKDPARYTMLRVGVDTPMDFDIDQVTRQSMDNPVYYVQYAHARICSVLRQGQARDFTPVPAADADLALLTHPMETALLRRLAGYEELVVRAAELRAPHRLTRYAEDLAADFHRFYAECRVLTEDAALSSARWWLVGATRQVLANTLGLIGVAAPERM